MSGSRGRTAERAQFRVPQRLVTRPTSGARPAASRSRSGRRGSAATMRRASTRRRLDRSSGVEIAEGIVVPAGDYGFATPGGIRRQRADARGPRPAGGGDFYGGTRSTCRSRRRSGRWRSSRSRRATSITTSRCQGAFTTHVVNGREREPEQQMADDDARAR